MEVFFVVFFSSSFFLSIFSVKKKKRKEKNQSYKHIKNNGGEMRVQCQKKTLIVTWKNERVNGLGKCSKNTSLHYKGPFEMSCH